MRKELIKVDCGVLAVLFTAAIDERGTSAAILNAGFLSVTLDPVQVVLIASPFVIQMKRSGWLSKGSTIL